MSTTATIRRVSHSDILGAPNAQELIDEYAAECSIEQIGQIYPQEHVYAAIEKSGLAQFFGVYAEATTPIETEVLVGFAVLLFANPPHYGIPVGVVESLFVANAHRSGGTGRALLNAIEDAAFEADCKAVLYSAPTNSRFAKLLEVSHDYVHTNVVYARRIQ